VRRHETQLAKIAAIITLAAVFVLAFGRDGGCRPPWSDASNSCGCQFTTRRTR